MEVSTNRGNKVQWTEEAKLLIRNIVRLDGFQRQQKEVLFEQLYVLWTTDGLISERNATKQFEDNSPFILESILETFDEKKKQYMITIESIHNSLKNGQPYMTTDDKVIHYTIDEKKKYRSLYYKNNNNLKYHFNKLLGEFLQYINEKNSPFLPIVPLIKSIETELLVPDPPAPRESLERNAKVEAVIPGHFAGMSTENTGGNKKKGGRMGNKKNSDDTNKVNKDLYFYIFFYY